MSLVRFSVAPRKRLHGLFFLCAITESNYFLIGAPNNFNSWGERSAVRKHFMSDWSRHRVRTSVSEILSGTTEEASRPLFLCLYAEPNETRKQGVYRPQKHARQSRIRSAKKEDCPRATNTCFYNRNIRCNRNQQVINRQ